MMCANLGINVRQKCRIWDKKTVTAFPYNKHVDEKKNVSRSIKKEKNRKVNLGLTDTQMAAYGLSRKPNQI